MYDVMPYAKAIAECDRLAIDNQSVYVVVQSNTLFYRVLSYNAWLASSYGTYVYMNNLSLDTAI